MYDIAMVLREKKMLYNVYENITKEIWLLLTGKILNKAK